MGFFKKKKYDKEATKKVFDFFKIEKTENETLLLGDFADKDFCYWLTFIHKSIQFALKTKLIDGKAIENYVVISFYIGGQRVEIAIIKDGCKGPHELLGEARGQVQNAV